MTTPDQPCGHAPFDPQALPVDAARDIVIRQALRHAPRIATEYAPLCDALDRVLAQDIVSPIDIPAHDNSAMDGYAFDGALLATAAQATLRLPVIGKVLAGHPFTANVPHGMCVRIMTGAPMPAGCDTVIAQEFADLTDNAGDAVSAIPAISFPVNVITRGANCRHAGEDLAAGRIALPAGRILRTCDIGLLASLGMTSINVKRRLRVAFFSTGDELRTPGEPLDDGGIYDSNRYTLHAMLRRLNVEALDFGIVRDEPAALEATLRHAIQGADAVITSGGVSVGDADFTRALLQTHGNVTFWGLAMRPGRPFAFGEVWSGEQSGQNEEVPSSKDHAALFFGLPGNPVATMVAFHQLVQPALLALVGAQPSPLPLIAALCDAPVRKRAGRTEFLRGVAMRNTQGQWHVRPCGSQGSGSLVTMSAANCFIVLAHERASVAAGEPADIILFDGLV